MTEFFLPFLIGYATSRILGFLLSSSRHTSQNPESVILKWDNTIFGWRIASTISEEDAGQKYMIAQPISSDIIFSMVRFRKNSERKN